MGKNADEGVFARSDGNAMLYNQEDTWQRTVLIVALAFVRVWRCYLMPVQSDILSLGMELYRRSANALCIEEKIP